MMAQLKKTVSNNGDTVRWLGLMATVIVLSLTAYKYHVDAVNQIATNTKTIHYLDQKSKWDTILLFRIATKVGVETEDVAKEVAKLTIGGGR